MSFWQNLFDGRGGWGLDISDFSLKIVSLEKPGLFPAHGSTEFRVSCFLRRDIPQGVIQNGVIRDRKKLIEIIRTAVAEAAGGKLKGKDVIVSLPEHEAFIRLVEMPMMTEEELRSAVRYEAESDIPLPLEEVYLDWKTVPSPLGDQNKHMDVLFGALPRLIVDDYFSLLSEAGLRVAVMEIESLATVRSLIFGGYSPDPLLIADLGSGRTSFIIFAGRAPRFTTSLPISGEKMISAIAQKADLGEDEARRLKYEYGLSDNEKGAVVSEALQPILTELSDQINSFINFYEGHKHKHGSSASISKVILCGGGANLIGLDLWLSTALKLPVEIGNPWINIYRPWSKEVPPIPYKDSLQYTTAIGLALLGAQS